MFVNKETNSYTFMKIQLRAQGFKLRPARTLLLVGLSDAFRLYLAKPRVDLDQLLLIQDPCGVVCAAVMRR